MNLKRPVSNLTMRLDRFDPVIPSSNKTGLSRNLIIPFDEWIEPRNTLHELNYFPDDFDQSLTYLSENGLNGERKGEDARKWNSDFLELIEYTKNSNYGRFKCFHCLLSPVGDDPIFIGINRLVAKGLAESKDEKNPLCYPCQIVNRFQCPYERTNFNEDEDSADIPPDAHTDTKHRFEVDNLFRLGRIAFVIEIALAKARKSDSEIQIKNKQDLFHTLTDRNTFKKILEQGDQALQSNDYLSEICSGQDQKYRPSPQTHGKSGMPTTLMLPSITVVGTAFTS